METTDGETALALVQARPEPFDLVLADLALPDVDARALAETLARYRPALPVLFMSADSDDGALISTPTMRVPVLQKPFSVDALVRAVRATIDRSAWLIAAAERELARRDRELGRLAAALAGSREARARMRDLITALRELRRSGVGLSAPTSDTSSGRSHSRILCVESDDGLRGLMVRVLQGAGHEVAAAADGFAALEIVQEHSPGWFDLIVTNSLTPSMPGTGRRRRALAGDPEQRFLRVIGDTDLLFEAGVGVASDVPVLRKPFTPGQLIACVEELVNRPCLDT